MGSNREEDRQEEEQKEKIRKVREEYEKKRKTKERAFAERLANDYEDQRKVVTS